MKFLITGLPGSTPIPREQGAELLQAGLVWIKSKLADGTIDSHYNIFGGGGLAIVNVGSHEQLPGGNSRLPAVPIFHLGSPAAAGF